MYRDFSERSKNNLLQLVSQVENEKWCDFTDWFGDRWYDFESWIGQLNIKNYLNNVNDYHKKVIDKNNTTSDTIETIFSRVNNADSYYSAIFADKRNQLNLWKKYIDGLNEIVNPSNGQFTTEYMSATMGELLKEYIEYMLTQRPTNAMYQELIDYDATSFFLDNRNPIVDAIAAGWTSDWIENITSQFGIGEDINDQAIRKSIESVIKEVLKHKHDATDFVGEFVDNLTPEELEWGEKIINYILDTGESLTESDIADILNIDVKDITESDYLRFLCDQDNLKFLGDLKNTVSETIGSEGYGDAINTIKISSEILGKLFNDYTEDVKYLEAIKQALIDGGYDNKLVNDMIDEMLWEYRNQYISAAKDGVEELLKMASEEGIDKALPLLGTFLDTKDITNDIIGLTDTTEDISNIYSTQQYSYALVKKYESCRQKLLSGTYTQNDVQECMIYFELAKAAKLQEYKAIKAIMEDALGSASTVFRSSEDEQYTRDMLAKVNAEIERLEGLSYDNSHVL